MTLFNHIKNLFNPEPKEQVLGYSISELQLLFQNSADTDNRRFSKKYPKKFSLDPVGINAFYVSQLIDKKDISFFMKCIDDRFQPESKKKFHNTTVTQSKDKKRDERLCYLITDEFEGYVIKLVTESVDFLNEIGECNFSVPPPWVAFKGYNPLWWGGSLQGEQGYYDDNFFSPFFKSLDADRREEYYNEYNASSDWKKTLEIFYDVDNEE